MKTLLLLITSSQLIASGIKQLERLPQPPPKEEKPASEPEEEVEIKEESKPIVIESEDPHFRGLSPKHQDKKSNGDSPPGFEFEILPH